MIEADQIAGNLWVGSAPPPGDVLRRHGFNTLVLCAEEHQPKSPAFPGMFVIHAPIDDADLNEVQRRTAEIAALEVARRLARGEKVLVTCWQGRNRSALVAALALKQLSGAPGQEVINLVRRRRARGLKGHEALVNPYFVKMVLRHEPARRQRI